MKASEFSGLFFALPAEQQSAALYYFLGGVAFTATDSVYPVTKEGLIKTAEDAIEFAKKEFHPEVKSA